MDEPSAKSLILELLSTLRPGSAMPVGALVEAGALFGISQNSVRVAVARLLAAGRIARDERGHYRPGETWQPIGRRLRAWREPARVTRRWNGAWVVVHPQPANRIDGRGRARAFRLLGFVRFLPSLWLRPDNLPGSVSKLRAELISLGLPASDLVATLGDLDPESDARARSSWDTDGLRRAYRELQRELEVSEARLERLQPEKAMVESFLVGGRAMRQLVLDPLLPEEICPSTERDALRERLRRYDRLGRLVWADLLRRYDVPYLRAPLDGRGEPGGARLAG